jgi:hemerythrin-like metal-binding protein
MDNQHQRLFLMVRQLDDSIAKGQGTFTVHPMWLELRAYAEYHFAHEERLMEHAHYPERARHHELHRALAANLEQLQRDYETAKLAVGVRSRDLIVRWLLEHICIEDRKLGSYLNSMAAR